MSFSDTSGQVCWRRRALVLPAAFILALYALGSASIVRAQTAPTSAQSGQLTGDGLLLTWSIGGADFDKPFYADRTLQAHGTVAAKTVTFSGVLRVSVPKGLYTDASVSAYVAIPFGPKRDVSWRGELSDTAGLSHELPFSLQIDVPPGKAAMFSASVGKTGGGTDMLGVMFDTAPSAIASTPTTSPTPTPTVTTTAPAPSSGGLTEADVIRAIATILSSLLAILGALTVMSGSKVDVQDVLNALRDLIRGARSADAEQAPPQPDPEAQKVAEITDALAKAADKLSKEGKYIANGNLFWKAWYGVPHHLKEAAGWLQDIIPNGPIDPLDESQADALKMLAGAHDGSPRPPAADPDPYWGQCEQAAAWGAKTMAEPVSRIFGPDVVLTKIVVQSGWNDFGNHIANEVITPGGQRYVIDMWQTMLNCGKPVVCTEEEWIRTWKNHAGFGKDSTISRGDGGSDYDSYLEHCIHESGAEAGIAKFRNDMRKHPGKAQTVINSYRTHPWPIENDYPKAPPPEVAPPAVDTPIQQMRGKLK